MPLSSSSKTRGRLSRLPGKNVGIPHAFRVVLRFLSFALSATIIGLLVHSLVLYHKTAQDRWRYPKGTMLPAWPPTAPTWRPTYLMLGASAVAAVLNALALVTLLGMVRFSHLLFPDGLQLIADVCC